ncbi:MAG TPA: CcmD family protein [Luteitalea sp.]|nr:CcmD family protein [Luteitalea sp.]
MKRLAGMALLVLTFSAALPASSAAQGTTPPSTTAAQDEYVPIDELPEGEKLPAAPFLVGAYTVLWLAILVYLLMLWRRLGRVERELQEARRATGAR